MNWLKYLPLEQISDLLAGFFSHWARLTNYLPAEQLPWVVYLVCSGLILLLWLRIMQIIPRPIKGISFMVLAAVLFTPAQAAGSTGAIAPAIIGVFYALLMQDFKAMFVATVPILMVLSVLLVIGAVWQMVKAILAAQVAKEVELKQIQEQRRRNLAQQENVGQ